MVVKELGGGTRLVVVTEQKFKTVLIRVQVRADLDDLVTARSVVSAVLPRGTRSFRDLRAVNRKLDTLYGAVMGADVVKIADWQVCSFTLSVVNERFLPGRTSVLREAVDLLRELLFEPARAGDAFMPPYVESEKENLHRALEALLNDKARYAAVRHVELMFPDEPYGRNASGRKEDIPGLTPENLWACYRRWMSGNPMEILVGGGVDPEEATELLAALAEGRHAGAPVRPITPLRPPGAVKEIVEELEIAQARLCMGFRHGTVVGQDGLAAIEVACGILGGFPHAKLFRRVRERESLAYSVGATYDDAKGVLFVTAGIDARSCDRVEELVVEAVDELRRGVFTPEDLAATKAGLVRRLVTVGDSLSSMLEHVYLWSLFGEEFSAEGLIRRIQGVTAEDVAAAAAGLSLDTVYVLREKENR